MTSLRDEAPWLNELPEKWQNTRIRNIAELSPAYSQEVPAHDELCTIIPMESVSELGAVDSSMLQPFEEASNGLPMFEEGDVIFAKITPCMENGKGAFIKTLPTRYAFGSTEFHVLRPNHGIDGRFLYYYTFNPAYRAYAAENMVGAAGQKRVSSRFLKDTRMFLPPLPEQRRIAAFLDQSCKAIDEAIAAKREQLEALDGVRRDAIQLAVTRGIAKQTTLRATDNPWIAQVPKHWGLVSLKRIAEIQSGLTLGKEYDGQLVERPYLRVANVQDGHLDLADVTTIEVPHAVAQRATLSVGDVLMTEGGDLDKLGRGTIWAGEIPDCLHQNHVFAIRCFAHKLIPAFLAYVTASQYGRDYFEATGKKTTNLAATNSTKVGQFPIPLPLLEEQRAICACLDEKLAHLRQVADCIQGQIDTLVEYRKSLIHEYVTGLRRVPVEQAEKVVAYG